MLILNSNIYDVGGKTMKKIIAFLLTVITICLCFVGCGKSAFSPVEDFNYEFKDGEVTITGYTGTDLEIVIPNIIEERSVTVIGEKAFQEYDMTSVIIPNTITLIEDSAFEDCKQLEKIDIPDSVTKISYWAFCGCENLKEVNIGSGLNSIEQGAFCDCDALKSIHIPENVENLYDIHAIRFGLSSNKNSGFTIYGKTGSAAETYAKENNITFIAE